MCTKESLHDKTVTESVTRYDKLWQECQTPGPCFNVSLWRLGFPSIPPGLIRHDIITNLDRCKGSSLQSTGQGVGGVERG